MNCEERMNKEKQLNKTLIVKRGWRGSRDS